MEKEDLKIGGYYVSSKNISGRSFIFKYNEVGGNKNPHVYLNGPEYHSEGATVGFALKPPFTKATQEQIDHLDACIAANKYVDAPEKPKFEVGKWYSFDWLWKYASYDRKTIIKVIEIDPSTVISSGYIRENQYRNGGGFNLKEIGNIKELTDLSEIQQYLPDGHEDKLPVKEEVKDGIPEYVKLLTDGWGFKKGDIAKVVELSKQDNYIVFVPNRNSTSALKPNVSYCKDDVEISTKEAYEAQFKKWVLKEDVKKEKKEVEPWSRGTYVVITKPYHSVEIGQVHKIDSSSSECHVQIDKSVGKSCWPSKSGLKWFATKEEAEVFAKTLKDEPKTEKQNDVKEIIPEKGKWYEIIEFSHKSKYVVRYNDKWKDCEYIYNSSYCGLGNFDAVKVVKELKSNDPKITEPLLEYAKKKYPVGIKIKSAYAGDEYSIKSNLFFSGENIDNGGTGYVYYNGRWAEIISLPEEKVESIVSDTSSKYKFKVGDSVKIVKDGYGIGRDCLGRIVTITELGEYFNENGYKISPAIGNSESSIYKGFNGEGSFELVKEESKLEEANRKYKVGMTIIDTFGDEDVILEEDLPFKETRGGIYTKGGNPELYNYSRDEWAIILEEPEKKWYEDPMDAVVKTEWVTLHGTNYVPVISDPKEMRNYSCGESSDLLDVVIDVPITIGE